MVRKSRFDTIIVGGGPAGSAIRPLVDRLLMAGGIARVPNRIETVSGAFGRELARSNDVIWVISEGVVAADLQTKILRKLVRDAGRAENAPANVPLCVHLRHVG